METLEKVARARVKTLDELDPRLLCCDACLELVRKRAGQMFYVYPNRRTRKRVTCFYCGVESEVTGVRLVEPIDNCTDIAAQFIDIDEGADHEQARDCRVRDPEAPQFEE